MFKSRIKNKYRKSRNARIYQGDILKDLNFVTGDPEREKDKDSIFLPFAVILSQDCDLQADFNCRNEEEGNQDKFLLSLLVCPAFIEEKFAQGAHFNDWEMQKFNGDQMKRIKKNDSYKRYHYLEESSSFSVPGLVVDFKHFFTLPRDFLYRQKKGKYMASLSELFREELSQRFTNYLSRIGIPELVDLKK